MKSAIRHPQSDFSSRRDAAGPGAARLVSSTIRAALFAVVVLVIVLVPRPSKAAFVRLGPFTNSVAPPYSSLQPMTNDIIVIAVQGDVANADGSWSVKGLPQRLHLAADGSTTNQLANNNYIVSNAFFTPIAFRVPLDSGPTVYSLYDLRLPGYSFFSTQIINGGTNGTITFNQVTNGLGYLPLQPSDTNGFIRLLQATNVSVAYSNSLYSYFTTQLAVQSELGLTNAFATNAAGVSYANGRIYVSTNYDALGAALAIGLADTNYALGASNALYADYTTKLALKASLVQATNIMALATNGFSPLVFTNVSQVLYTNALPALTNGFIDKSFTNNAATRAELISATNGIAGSVGISALTGTNIFNSLGGVTATNGANLTTKFTSAGTNAILAIAEPLTNGFVDASITNNAATKAYAQSLTNGFVDASITNNAATKAYAQSLTNGFVDKSITNNAATVSFSESLTNGLASVAYADTNHFYKVAITASTNTAHTGNLNLIRVTPYASIHATVKVGGKLYAGGDQGGLFVINDPDGDMSSITSTSLPPAFQCCYIPSTGLIYFIGTNQIISVNPANIVSQSTIVTGYDFGQATMATDGTNLFVGAFDTNKLFKFSPLGVPLLTNTFQAGMHGSGWDAADNVFFFTTVGGVIAKVNPADLTFTFATIGGMPTDDLAILGNSVYVGSESDTILRKVSISDLSFTTSIADRSYGVFTDGTNLFNCSRDGVFTFYPNANLAAAYRYSVGTQPNELWITDSNRYVVTDFAGNTVYRIDPTLFNLGSGTPSPGYNLDVRGDFRADAATVYSLNFMDEITGQNFSVDRLGDGFFKSLNLNGPDESGVSPLVIDTLGTQDATGGISFYDSANDGGASLFLSNSGQTLTVDDEPNFAFTDVWIKKPLKATSFTGNGSGITNLIHGPTVSAGSGATVTLSQNTDGSTNYQVALSSALAALTNADTRPWTNASAGGIWSTNLGDGANTNLVGVTKAGQLFDINFGSGFTYDAGAHSLSSTAGAFATSASNFLFLSKVSSTNGFATGLIATNTTLQGNVSFGADGTDTNILSGNGTNYVGFYNAGSGQATNGCFKWTSSLNCYTNTVTAAILTNNSTAWLLQTNGVTLYSISGANPIGSYTAVSGALPAPFSVRGFALDLNRMFLEGYLSAQNIQILSNAITANVTITTTNNFIANLNGKGTNTFLTNAVLNWSYGAIGLGLDNAIETDAGVFGNWGTVSGGFHNFITNTPGNYNTIAGGNGNTISGQSSVDSVISGGTGGHITNSFYGFLGSGQNNIIAGIPGGGTTTGMSILGGEFNTITNYAPSPITADSSILGGMGNVISRSYDTAAGKNVNIKHDSVFSWSDGIADTSTTNSQARFTATNGLYLNGPLWLGIANTNSGIFFRSNQFSLWAVTNSWGTNDFWAGSSNGVPVWIWNSNGTPVMKNIFP